MKLRLIMLLAAFCSLFAANSATAQVRAKVTIGPRYHHVRHHYVAPHYGYRHRVIRHEIHREMRHDRYHHY